MSVNTAAKRFSMMSMGVTWLIPPVEFLAGTVVFIVRMQLIGAYPFSQPLATAGFQLDATYFVTKRYIAGPGQWVYYSERMDDRLWTGTAEDPWCVDAGLAYPLYTLQATLSPAAASGTQNITSYIVESGGTGGLTAATAVINDPTGTGATASVTVVGGTVSQVLSGTSGSFYTNPQTVILSQNGAIRSDVIVQAVITNKVLFQVDSPVFTSTMIGNVIRIGTGIATITDYIDAMDVLANVTTPIGTPPSDPGDTPLPAAPGDWTIAIPTSTVTGLNHLEGMTVTGLADGFVISPRVVTNGAITLDQPATFITVGLGFTAQVQSLRLDLPGQGTTQQGKRKNVMQVTARVKESRGFKITTNQPDASTQPDQVTPVWSNLVEWKQRGAVTAGNAVPLFSGDAWIQVKPTWRKEGQVGLQQDYPLPLNLLALIPETEPGDQDG